MRSERLKKYREKQKEDRDYLRWALLVLMVLAPPFGCGEPATEESATDELPMEETTTATATANNSSLVYVALGDSLATGYGSAEGYVYRYADLLGEDTGS